MLAPEGVEARLKGQHVDRPVGTLGFGILTLLARRPLTGYEISRLMQVPVGYMWTASHSQIYGELGRLEEDKLVRHRVVEGPGPRDTKRYELTARGRRALIRWVDSPLQAQPARSELMLRVRGFWLLSPQRCRDFVESVRLDHEQRLTVYRAEDQDFTGQHLDVTDPAHWSFGAYAALQAGLRSQEAMIDWCTWLLDQLDGTAPPAHPTPSSGPLLRAGRRADPRPSDPNAGRNPAPSTPTKGD